jgi:nucleotide-binding universal stress UspA family protein
MSKPIIVAYDPNTADRAPVDFGVAAARFTGAPLVVASVSARSGARGGPDEDLVADASEVLAQVRRELEPEGISVECRELENTSAPRALHEAAEAADAGLLVVGSTRRGPVGRVLPGSTADRLMHGSPCPIAIVPHDWQAGAGLHTIGVAYVDTEEGHEALLAAHAFARRAGAKLRVLTAVKAGLGVYSETEAGTEVRSSVSADDLEGELRARTESTLQDVTAGLGADVTLEIDAFVDDPADVLIRVSENLDLLVCGSRGYGPLRAVLLGGVSRRLAADAQCPLIVLARGAESSLEALMADAPGAATT